MRKCQHCTHNGDFICVDYRNSPYCLTFTDGTCGFYEKKDKIEVAFILRSIASLLFFAFGVWAYSKDSSLDNIYCVMFLFMASIQLDVCNRKRK